MVGGELTLSALEVTVNTSSGVCEAPIQLKANCGVLVIDDFGRQRIPPQDLLNRWIVPLEKRYDYLNLPNGKKITVPFDELIIFSTNLEPADLVDEAFLRRIPYKIEVPDPTEEEFRELFRRVAPSLGFRPDDSVVDYLLQPPLPAHGSAAPILPPPRPCSSKCETIASTMDYRWNFARNTSTLGSKSTLRLWAQASNVFAAINTPPTTIFPSNLGIASHRAIGGRAHSAVELNGLSRGA